jgi:hypothetical protein
MQWLHLFQGRYDLRRQATCMSLPSATPCCWAVIVKRVPQRIKTSIILAACYYPPTII